MALFDKLQKNVEVITRQRWNERGAKKVPSSHEVTMKGGAVKFNAVVLYADLAGSTQIAIKADDRVAAKLFKSYLSCSSEIIRAHGGAIRSFDGDRVMGVFLADSGPSDAVRAALNINYAFKNIIQPAFADYKSLQSATNYLGYGVGIDVSKVYLVRAGIRDHNDLVWVGRAPNVAAKLSNERAKRYPTYITKEVFRKLDHETKVDSKGKNRWQSKSWGKVDGIDEIYRSSHALEITL